MSLCQIPFQLKETEGSDIPTDLTIQLVGEEVEAREEGEEGFEVVQEPMEVTIHPSTLLHLQVGVHRLVLALVSPVLRLQLYTSPLPSVLQLVTPPPPPPTST